MNWYYILAIVIAGVGLLSTIFFQVFKISTNTKVSIAKIDTYVRTEFQKVKSDYDRMRQELDEHKAMTEKKFDQYHKESREDAKETREQLKSLDKKIDSVLLTLKKSK